VSALDVSIQSQILNLLMDLKARLQLSYVFISHDLAVVEHVSDRVAVMYLGRVVETTTTPALYAKPAHPYTQALMSAVPAPDPERRSQRIVLTGEPPSPESPPPGCPFHPRCPQAMERCRTEVPAPREIGPAGAPHQVSCHLY
jgi:oligopeptide/dipeptide ABC transporter ATP-binding protein